MKSFLALLVFSALGSGCMSNADATRETLRKQGYTNVEPRGLAWLSCSEDDFYRTHFTATNPSGEPVSGVVCCGLIFKNCTTRF